MHNLTRIPGMVWGLIVAAVRVVRYFCGLGFRWVVLALTLASFTLGMYCLFFGPYTLIYQSSLGDYWWYLRPPGTGPVITVSLFLTALFLWHHYRLLSRKSQRIDE